ncbi:ATP-binding protein [Tepidibacter hydrothermalis]|uniref:ATP-binding protein n=1 Tax=Tepidibacter hydrothermalis TaxID=3036126 RepID=A0ABY8ECG0_9FIRM|nr:ATP-binding protein [Tepidibacter hydrothermalis]WFD09595.1 ATP-binding protein [Tepidibacter hydrothermalis]
MNIAVLSGKGGTGKTTVSTNISLALNANYIDCDVEEPNGFLFLQPSIDRTDGVSVEYPHIDEEKCISCGECVKNCNFNALVNVKNEIMVFDKLCHSCGACEIVCKSGAIKYKLREIGKIEEGKRSHIKCTRGILNIGEPMAVPIIKKILNNIETDVNIIDCPPGTSCNVVNSLKYADMAVLVTEPTEFGLHDLKMAVELVRMFDIPFGIVINKDNVENNLVRNYCENEEIDVIGRIPYSKDIARIYSRGNMLYDDLKYKNVFDEIAQSIKGVFSWN